MTPARLYIVTTTDLPPGVAAAQAAHASFAFSRKWPDLTRDWLIRSQYLIIVTVPDEEALIRLASTALETGIKIATFHEPDMGNQTTAVALEPGEAARRLCGALPLLGREQMARTG